MAPQKLTSAQFKVQAFVEAYAGEAEGNGAKAAEIAGYAKGNSAKVTASRLLKRADVRAAIANRQQEIANAAAIADAVRREQDEEKRHASIADAAERREVLSTMLRDAAYNPAARVKAADVLNKMDGLYVTKLGVPGADGQPLGVRRVVIELDDASGRA